MPVRSNKLAPAPTVLADSTAATPASPASPATAAASPVKRSWLKKIVYASAAALGALALGVGACTLLAVYWAAPSLEKFQIRSNVIYDRQGGLLYEMMTPDDYHRILTQPHEVDPLYLKMLLSSEDERFYEHWGVDPFSVMRALLSNILAGKRVSGASTLAMQVCRLLEPKERTLLNKFKEALGAMYLTNKYGREQILTMYLTLAPFGGNLEGVTAASYSYFNHSPAELSPAEAALLVALPRSPEKIRPDKHHAAALYYRNEVLSKAVEDGVIKADILETATREGVPQFTRDIPDLALHLGQSLYAGKLHPLLADLVRDGQAFMTPMDRDCPPFGYPVLEPEQPSGAPANATPAANVTTTAPETTVAAIPTAPDTTLAPDATGAQADGADADVADTADANVAYADTAADADATADAVDAVVAAADTADTAAKATAEVATKAETDAAKEAQVAQVNNAAKEGKAAANLQAADSQHLAERKRRLRMRFDIQGRRLPSEVFTTIDPLVQKTLFEVNQGYRQDMLHNLPQENIGMLAVDNQTFEVLGYVCSDQSFVDVIQAQRSPGSALKPFVYALAFEQGLVHPNSVLLDLGKIYRTYQPRNYDRMFFGEITAAEALQGSLNLPALEVMRAVGPVNFVDHLNAYPNTITNRYLSQPQLEQIKEAPAAFVEATSAVETAGATQTADAADAADAAHAEDASPASSAPHNSARTTSLAAYRHPDFEPSKFDNSASAAVQRLSSFSPLEYIRGRIKLMPNTAPHIGVILGACSISLYDLTQLYAALAHDGQITPLNVLSAQQNSPKRGQADGGAGAHGTAIRENGTGAGTGVGTGSEDGAGNGAGTGNEAGAGTYASGQASDASLAETGMAAHNSRLEWTTFLEPDTARATYNLLEGLPKPAGFNYDRHLKISYKTGTSFKYRDAVAIGSRGSITIGVWQGRTDGSPSALAVSAYEKTAPILFRALTMLPEREVFKPLLKPSSLLSAKPPQALAQLEIKTLGLTGLRRSNDLERKVSFTQGVPLEIVYPSDGMHIQAGMSGQVLLQIQGGNPPYYVLIDDQVQKEQSYFTPQHNGIHTITAIDSSGSSQAVQIWVQGVPEEDSSVDFSQSEAQAGP